MARSTDACARLPELVAYKSERLRAEFLELLHPEVRALVFELAAELEARMWPGVVLTHVVRTPEDSEEIYLPFYLRQGKPEALARRLARARWSWHRARCAVDMRNREWTPAQRRELERFLRSRWPNRSRYEVLMHDVGAGDHLHLGVRDEVWKAATLPR